MTQEICTVSRSKENDYARCRPTVM